MMKESYAETLAWIAVVLLTVLVLLPFVIIDHIKLVRKVKRQANARRLSDKEITVTGDIIRIRKGVKA